MNTYFARTDPRYNGSADIYEEWFHRTPMRRYLWRKEATVLEKILRGLPPGATILDMPTGKGRFLPMLEANRFRLLGGDLSINMLQAALPPQDLGSQFQGYVQCDAEILPFRDEAVDYILSIRFMDRLPQEVGMQVLMEFNRVCAKGLILQVPLNQPLTPLVTRGRNLFEFVKTRRLAALRGGKIRRKHLFPMNLDDLHNLSHSLNLRTVAVHNVSWFGGRTKICILEKVPTEHQLLLHYVNAASE